MRSRASFLTVFRGRCLRGPPLVVFFWRAARALTAALDAFLSARGQALDAVLALEVPKELLMERAVLRRTDKRTGQIYHLKYKPPPPGTEVEHRADDREEVVCKRLDTYEQMTSELLPYYEKRGILKRVDGVGDVEDVRRRVLEA